MVYDVKVKNFKYDAWFATCPACFSWNYHPYTRKENNVWEKFWLCTFCGADAEEPRMVQLHGPTSRIIEKEVSL